MEIFQTVTTRRCIRKFRPDPVPGELVRELLEAARWSPSWGNTQPWEIVVVAGEPLKRFREANRKRFMEGAAAAPDTPMPEVWPELFKRRYTEVGKRVLTALLIPREDVEARVRYGGDMAALFDAPCLLLFCVDKGLAREYAMLDIGAIQQTVCLLAHARGLGSCILAASVRYPALIREAIKIQEGKAVIIGVALGYPDSEAPINHFARERATPDEFITWVS
ncbi:MAG: nitroreductase [Proteobacteria bacterium]|nr:nitroreductase [Pseudomonadota bacterium]MBU2228636.1 nitroreductase [Pseudomonadota bacterium]MBU2261710.1 nitroreductase [Pseudomonadota bacterium]